MYNLYEIDKERHNNIPFYAVMMTRYIVDPEFYKSKTRLKHIKLIANSDKMWQ